MKLPAETDSVEILNRDMAKKNLGGHWFKKVVGWNCGG